MGLDWMVWLAEFVSEYVPSALAVLAAIVFYAVYVMLFPKFDKPKGSFKGNFDHLHDDFLRKRRRAFPPPFPNGWYKLCDVRDLNDGNIVSVSCVGVDLVVFKGRDAGMDQVGVLDAFCPHLGAHLGQGGTVVGNCIQCPFHGWRMDATGQCQSIPYLEKGYKVPSSAKTKAYQHTIYMGMVFLWHHAEGEAPTYQLMPLPELETSWVRCGAVCTSYDMHIVDMAENSADYFHFNYLHGPIEIPLLKQLISMSYETKVFFPEDEAKRHTIYFENFSVVHLLKRFRFPWYTQKTVVTFDGPGVVHFDIKTPLGNIWLIKTNLPRRPFEVYSEDVWFAEKRTPRWLVRLVAQVAKGALEQDRTVWQNRLFNPKPFLVKGDGPFVQYRKWFDQFYSENSDKAAANGAALSW